ncbi:MAG: hypothetical protein KDD32_05995 [Bacteroidetes bacterium]|nr:hypothetical protein [Bacteroidota bacterium]
MNKVSIVILFHLIILVNSCSNIEKKPDGIEWIKYNSDSTISETKSIAIDSTITWSISYENSIVNNYIGGKLQTAHYNKPYKTMGAYMMSDDSIIFVVDQKVFFSLNDTTETYNITGSPMVLLNLNIKDSTLYQGIYVFQPAFCDSTKVSLLYRDNEQIYYGIKDKILQVETVILNHTYDSTY